MKQWEKRHFLNDVIVKKTMREKRQEKKGEEKERKGGKEGANGRGVDDLLASVLDQWEESRFDLENFCVWI